MGSIYQTFGKFGKKFPVSGARLILHLLGGWGEVSGAQSYQEHICEKIKPSNFNRKEPPLKRDNANLKNPSQCGDCGGEGGGERRREERRKELRRVKRGEEKGVKQLCLSCFFLQRFMGSRIKVNPRRDPNTEIQ